MISFKNLKKAEPYFLLHSKYEEAKAMNQKNIEAIAISSYSRENDQVDSRYVNLKIIEKDNFIFFSNYNSKKSIQFSSNNKISALLFWNSINLQIRLKAEIFKLDDALSDRYFLNRQKEKNALAISSKQSEPIKSFDDVKLKYENALKNADLKNRPEYWGGYRFIPYEFEFWVGHKYRLNQRTQYNLINGKWQKTLLQP